MKRRIYICSILALVLLLSGCISSGGGGPKSTILRGSIYDKTTNELVKETVIVTLEGKDSIEVSEGAYNFLNVEPGPQTLKAVAEGYKPYENTIFVKENETNTENIYLLKEGETGEGADDEEREELEVLVQNIRNAGISLTNVWEPQYSRLGRHIKELVEPFGQELAEMIYAVMDPLKEINEGTREGFSLQRKDDKLHLWHEADDEPYRVEYLIDIEDSFSNQEPEVHTYLSLSFELFLENKTVARGEGTVKADIVASVYEDWIQWLESELDEQYAPDTLFFTVSEMDANAWFETPTQGRIEAHNFRAELNALTNALELSGKFYSSVVYHDGILEVAFEEHSSIDDWDFSHYPKDLIFEGVLRVSGIAEVEGILELTLVPNAILNKLLPGYAVFDGSYRELFSSDQVTLATGVFTYDWENSSLYTGDSAIMANASFDGYIQEAPTRPKIKLRLDANSIDLSEISLDVDYLLDQYSLEGRATIQNTVKDDKVEWLNMSVVLLDKNGLIIELYFEANTDSDVVEIGEIKGKSGQVLAEIKMMEGTPYIYYNDGSFETLL